MNKFIVKRLIHLNLLDLIIIINHIKHKKKKLKKLDDKNYSNRMIYKFMLEIIVILVSCFLQ